MNVKFYTFSKKRNSTQIPVSAALYSIDIAVNDPDSSILTPAITISIPSSSILACNYCYIDSFSRYYYITNWVYNANGTWTANCNVDSLASWRNAIFSSPGYVGRAEDSHIVSPQIQDRIYPAVNDYSVNMGTINVAMSASPALGSFIIGVISKDSPNLGAVGYYIIDSSNLATMVSNMLTSAGSTVVDWTNTDSLTSDVLKTLVNPLNYIVACKWFPFNNIDTTGTSLTEIHLGGWSTGAQGRKLFNTRHLESDVYTVTNIANALDYPPYSRYTFISPVFGTYELDGTILSLYKKIKWSIDTNLISGMSTLRVCSANADGTVRYELFRSSAMLAIDIPLAQISTNYIGTAKSALSTAGAAADVMGWLSNPVGQGATVASGIIDTVAQALSPSVQSVNGIVGGIPFEIGSMYVEQISYSTVSQADNIFGKPVKRYLSTLVTQLNTSGHIEGYIIYDVSLFNGACTQDEKTEIIEFLEGGVYLE